jgi:cyclase
VVIERALDFRRIIPCLDVKDGRLVKGVKFVDMKDIGDPAEIGGAYSDAGADELVFLDITASVEKRKFMLDTILRTVTRIAIPLTVGGGVRTCNDIEELMNINVSKVSINTAAVKNPDLVKEAVGEFGSHQIVVAIDTRKSAKLPSGFEVVINGGTQGTGMDAVEWAKRVVGMGAGAILPTSMDTDGTQGGYDIPMTRAIADAVEVPVIASGGAGKLEHLEKAIVDGHADAVLVASIVHFGTYTIGQIKEYLKSKGIAVRI